MLTPSKDRDSKWSTPLASVKNRSNGSVMSVSISCGGMPEKKVATTTCGMLIGGKRSTGILAMPSPPSSSSARQITTMKYGLRIENPGMGVYRLLVLRLVFGGFHRVRLHRLTGLQRRAVAD